MEEIIRFVSLAQTDRFTLTDLCEQFGISRKTAYKHLERYAVGGWKALAPRSHRPHVFPGPEKGVMGLLTQSTPDRIVLTRTPTALGPDSQQTPRRFPKQCGCL